MKALSHLLYKVTLSSMIVSAPAMITGNHTEASYGTTAIKEARLPYFFIEDVIKKFVNYSSFVSASGASVNAELKARQTRSWPTA